MTREEAIECIEAIHVQMFNSGNSKWTKACDMAIEALKETERNPTITSWYDFDRGYEKGKASARPHGEWIPVSERLPEENKTVIASTEYGVFPEARYTKEDGWEWAYESGADYWEELEDVIAWMPLPEPYEGEGEPE